ncbi:hypothetical protein [Streptomyces sp. NPDC101776]|uniref:hypothetical protein n=1 Tax=Streptomyces sp. NPDC101776 TaxID=3366146 RepID=UPI0038214771
MGDQLRVRRLFDGRSPLIAELGAVNVLLVDTATFAVAAPLYALGVRGLSEAQAQRRGGWPSLRAYRRELADR